jgi:hypothetical protein
MLEVACIRLHQVGLALMTEAYDGREVVGMDLHRRRSVLVRMTGDGRKLETARITNSPAELRRQIARAGKSPRVVLEATYGWYWAADTLAAAGATRRRRQRAQRRPGGPSNARWGIRRSAASGCEEMRIVTDIVPGDCLADHE